MLILELLKSLFLGIVQGITEWLPVSSTGHLILFDEFIKLNVSDEFMNMYEVVIQLGSILAVLVLYFNRLNPFRMKDKKLSLHKPTLTLWAKVIVGIIPAGVLGILLDDWFHDHFFNFICVAVALIVYGIAFIVIERKNKNKNFICSDVSELSYKRAFGIGCFQVLSLIPGTSRSGSTIIGASLLGVSRTAAAEFSFFMAVPVMLGASLLKLLKFGFSFTLDEFAILSVGFITAFLVSLAAIKFLMDYVKRHSFEAFGWYRIILGVALVCYYVVKELCFA